ncbi:MAG: hypothetical protein A2710_26510 [Burkholderiales bacterium RIFCSPHIGHO2_01_FULL_64_960]|nr:MAG: hypothetical protein A2710_26510 [Burkholderiales bacterium RIFCSPHIGHO2_01_FULL_64_960]
MSEKNTADEAAFIADLNATFPGCSARSLRQWSGNPAYIGAVVGGEADVIDGEPIAPYVFQDSAEYDGWVHGAFAAWVSLRGWYVEVYEPGTLWVVPISRSMHPDA